MENGSKWGDTGEPQWIRGNNSRQDYLNQSETTLRIKLVLTLAFAPFGHAITMPIMAVKRVVVKKSCSEISKVLLFPIAYLGMILVSGYGIVVEPRNASKVYSEIETAVYGKKALNGLLALLQRQKHSFLEATSIKATLTNNKILDSAS